MHTAVHPKKLGLFVGYVARI